MMMPNWFDQQYGDQLAKASAEDALALVAKSPEVIRSVTEALAFFDEHAGQKGWAGPSRTQAVRSAIVQALTAK